MKTKNKNKLEIEKTNHLSFIGQKGHCQNCGTAINSNQIYCEKCNKGV